MEYFCCVFIEYFQWLIRVGGYIIDTNIFVFIVSGYYVFEILLMVY